MISFENVSKFILSDVSIYVPPGKTVGLIGASGAGKTTFMKLASSLLLPEEGKVFIMGYSTVGKQKKFCKDIGVFLTEVPLLEKEDTVIGNFEVLKSIYGIDRKVFEQDYKELSRKLGFADLEKQRVKELSLGQRRRAELGAVLLHRPKLLLLDEPTNGLDENGRCAFYELIEERKKDDLTVLLTSHNMTEVSGICDRIALLDKGRFLYYGEETLLRKQFAPIYTIHMEVEGKLPDLQDLPLLKYCIDGQMLQLMYHSGHITAAEIFQLVLSQSVIKEVKVHKPDLFDVVMQINKERMGEHERVNLCGTCQ